MKTFPSPRSVEEALQRKRLVADDVSKLQAQLKDRFPTDTTGKTITGTRERSDYRQRLKHELALRYEEARFLKDWLRLHATRKPSEWEMLGRAYRLLTTFEEQGVTIGEEGESLLGDLEMHVPHVHLVGAASALKSA